MSGAKAIMVASAGAPGVINTALDNFNSAVGSSGFGVANDGTYNTGTDTGNWVNPHTTTVAAFYQVKVDVTSGAFSSGDSTGSYLDCSSSRSWNKTAAGSVTFTVSFREKATGIVRSTQTGITIQVL